MSTPGVIDERVSLSHFPNTRATPTSTQHSSPPPEGSGLPLCIPYREVSGSARADHVHGVVGVGRVEVRDPAGGLAGGSRRVVGLHLGLGGVGVGAAAGGDGARRAV